MNSINRKFGVIITVALVAVLVAVVIFFLLFGLSGRTWYQGWVANVAYELDSEVPCKLLLFSQLTWHPEDSCIAGVAINMAFEKSDPDQCERAVSLPDIVSCYESMARYLGDVAVCKKISCKSCRGSCYANFIHNKEDIKICESEQDDTSRSACLLTYVNEIDNNLDICKRDDFVKYKSECFASVARYLRDPSICALIEENALYSSLKESCLSEAI